MLIYKRCMVCKGKKGARKSPGSPGTFKNVPGLLDFFSPGTMGPRDLQGLQVLSPGRPGTFPGLPGTSRDQKTLCFCTFLHFFLLLLQKKKRLSTLYYHTSFPLLDNLYPKVKVYKSSGEPFMVRFFLLNRT